MKESWAKTEFKNMQIADDRIIKRVIKTAETLANNPEGSIPHACNGKWPEIKAIYRLFNNERLTAKEIIMSHRKQTIERMKEHDVVLAIQDTTNLNYSTHPNTKGLGLIDSPNDNVKGIMCHTTLAVSTNGTPLGILAQRFWTRDINEKGKSKNRRKRAIKDKESNKWLEALDESLVDVHDKTKVVTVCDRESDIYDFFHKAVSENKHFLIRATYDRVIENGDKKLKKEIESKPVAGEIVVNIPRDTKNNYPEREAKLAIKFGSILLKPPLSNINSRNLAKIELQVISAKEIDAPNDVDPIDWLLFTTLSIESLEDAVEKIGWYKQRWKIERFHYTLKSGCKIEELQLETADRLERAIALYSVIAWRIMWLKYLSEDCPDESCTIIFKEQEWKTLYCMVKKTSTPPDKPPTIKEACILLAKLGGFIGRKGDGNPGVKVLWRGMQRLMDITEFQSIINSQS